MKSFYVAALKKPFGNTFHFDRCFRPTLAKCWIIIKHNANVAIKLKTKWREKIIILDSNNLGVRIKLNILLRPYLLFFNHPCEATELEDKKSMCKNVNHLGLKALSPLWTTERKWRRGVENNDPTTWYTWLQCIAKTVLERDLNRKLKI